MSALSLNDTYDYTHLNDMNECNSSSNKINFLSNDGGSGCDAR